LHDLREGGLARKAGENARAALQPPPLRDLSLMPRFGVPPYLATQFITHRLCHLRAKRLLRGDSTTLVANESTFGTMLSAVP
jgi:hypothetical protein